MAAGRLADRLAERSGRVVDVTGAPVPDALVAIVASTVPMPEIALLSDTAGRFAVRLPPGRFTLRAHGAGGTGEVEVDGAPTDHEILIVTEAAK
jgi:hypothetical protein